MKQQETMIQKILSTQLLLLSVLEFSLYVKNINRIIYLLFHNYSFLRKSIHGAVAGLRTSPRLQM